MTTSKFPAQENAARNDIPVAWHEVTPQSEGAEQGYWWLRDFETNADADEIYTADPRYCCYLTTNTSANAVIVVELHSVTGERIEVPVHSRGVLAPVYANGWYETTTQRFETARMYVGFPEQTLTAADQLKVTLRLGNEQPDYPVGGSDGIASEIGRNPPPS